MGGGGRLHACDVLGPEMLESAVQAEAAAAGAIAASAIRWRRGSSSSSDAIASHQSAAIGAGDDPARYILHDRLFWSAVRADDRGQTAGVGFHHRLAERVGPRGEDEQIAAGIERRKLRIILHAGEMHRKIADGPLHLFEIRPIPRDDQRDIISPHTIAGKISTSIGRFFSTLTRPA